MTEFSIYQINTDRDTARVCFLGYEVSTHFNPEGNRCVLQQFRDLILSEDLLENRIIAEIAKAR